MKSEIADYIKANGGKYNTGLWDFFRFVIPTLLFSLGWVLSAQVFAHSMNYDTSIVGRPANIGKYEVYSIFVYLAAIVKNIANFDFHPYILSSLVPLAVFTSTGLTFVFVWEIARMVKTGAKTSHGTARIAAKKDLKKNGLLGKKDGVILGQLINAKVKVDKNNSTALQLNLKKEAQFISHTGKANTLLLAPTGSGKGVSVIIPTLLSYKGSMIVFDPKGENYNITAGWRRKFSRIIRFAPCSNFTARFNPVMAIRDSDEFSFRDASLIADIFFVPPKQGSTTTEEYFSNSAKDMLITTLLHVRFCDQIKDKSLAGVLNFLTYTDYETLQSKKSDKESSQGDEQFMGMIDGKHYYRICDKNRVEQRIEAISVHQKVANGAMRQLNMNSREKASVFKTVFTKLQLFEDPLLAGATRGNDFEIEDFISCEDPITLYLTVPYSDVQRILPVFKMLISFVLKKFSEGEVQHKSAKHENHLLFMLDDFPILGYFPHIVQAMGVLRGYGVNFLIVCQALSQLVDIYGKHHPFLDHCVVQVVFAPGSIDDAEEFSRGIGNKTFSEFKISSSGRRFSSLSNFNFTGNTSAQRLLDASDIKRLSGNKCLILAHGMQPYIAIKCVYYQDSRFKEKLKFKAPQTLQELYQELAGLPSVIRQKKERENKAVIEVRGNAEEIDNDIDMFDHEFDSLRFEIQNNKSELKKLIELVYEEIDEKDKEKLI